MHSTHDDLKKEYVEAKANSQLSQNGSTGRVSKASKLKEKKDKEAAKSRARLAERQ